MAGRTVISAQNLDKFYGDFQALKNISIEVGEGERVVICGPSGSGKSTLIRCFNALEFHQGGTLEVQGAEVFEGSKDVHRLRQEVGMVFQQFNLFPHLTVLENLMIGPLKVRKASKEEAERIARKYLDRVRIPEQADKYPRQLSGGQQQRVAIARSLCMESKIILFDEPTSALDPEMINEVLDVMVELAEDGMTMVCVTHEMGFARKVADRMVFMDGGEIVEVAEPETFFTAPRTARCRDFLEKILQH
ncbi:MAG: amino acid ABC transporter ATP-binding protein [Pseudomonadota bacterium]